MTASGPVSIEWRRAGVTLTESANTWIPGAHFWYLSRNSGPLDDGLYQITWSSGARTIGTASVTRDCS